MSDSQRNILYWVLLILAVPASYVGGRVGGQLMPSEGVVAVLGTALLTFGAFFGAAFYVGRRK